MSNGAFELEPIADSGHRSPSPLLDRPSGNSSNPYTGTAQRTAAHTADVDPKMAPLYQSINDAKASARMNSGGSAGSAANQQDGPGSEQQQPANEYDIITDRHRVQHVMQADNALYGTKPNDSSVLSHPTLSFDRRHYTGGSSSMPPEPDIEEESSCGGCRSIDYWLCGFMLIAVVISVAALAFALIIFLGVYNPFDLEAACNCPNPNTDTTDTPTEPPSTGTSDEIIQLMSELNDLKAELNQLQMQMNESDSVLASKIQTLRADVDIAKQNVTDLANTPTDVSGLEFSANISNLDTASECFEEDHTCGFTNLNTPTPYSNPCETDKAVLDMTGFHISSMVCELRGNNGNPIVATLRRTDMVNGTYQNVVCSCHQVALIDGLSIDETAICILRVIRCPSQVSSPVNITT